MPKRIKIRIVNEPISNLLTYDNFKGEEDDYTGIEQEEIPSEEWEDGEGYIFED